MSIQQFKNLSSWREDILNIKGGEVVTLDFNDTTPNMFVVQNPNPVSLKISISSYPRTDSYEYKVDGNMTETMGRPISTNKIHILNDGSTDAVVRVYSINDTFDVQILKNMTVALNNATVETDGLIRGFSSGVSLPSGSNSIGNVGFNDTANVSIQNILENLNTLSDNSLSLKDYVLETYSFVCDIFDIFNDSYPGTNLVNNILQNLKDNFSNILQYLKDNFSNIVMDNKNYSTFGSLFVQAVEKIVDTPAVINGDVNINKDYFWKENIEKVNGSAEPLIDFENKLISNNDNCYIYIDNNTTSTSANGRPSKSNVTVTKINNNSAKLTFTDKYAGSSTLTLSKNVDYVLSKSGLICIKESYLYNHGWSNERIKTSNPLLDSDYLFRCVIYFELDIKHISGILYDMKRIKSRNYSDIYTVGASKTTSIRDNRTSEKLPVKIFDKIDKIRSSSALKCRIYYSFSDYVEFDISSNYGIDNLEMEIYAVELVNSSTEEIRCSILGGLY